MTDPRVDRYIARAAEFARPILTHLREVVHQGCPEVQEAMKWSRPAFLYRGKILGIMSAFKQHCTFGFWHPEVNRQLAAAGVATNSASGSLGRLTRVDDLPPTKELLSYVREAVALTNEAALLSEATTDRDDAAVLGESKTRGKTRARRGPTARKAREISRRTSLEIPAELATGLNKNKAAGETFRALPPSQRDEYVEWIAEAKRDETRQKRIATALEWLAEGKPRHWKYMTVK